MHISCRTRTRIRAIFGAVVLVAAAGAGTAAKADTPDWATAMRHVPLPGIGCFTPARPALAWRHVACSPPSHVTFPPPSDIARPRQSVGSGTDFGADVSGPNIYAVEGSFPAVSPGISESGPIQSQTGPSVTDAYSLQVNSKPFNTPLCVGPSCQGWQQYVYANDGVAGGNLLIEYWMLNYAAACPAGWFSDGAGDCVQNSPLMPVADQPISSLGGLTLAATAGSATDSATLLLAGVPLVAISQPSVLSLASDWSSVEFMVGGDGGRAQANFGPGTTITVQTVVHNGSTSAPGCHIEGWTGETNNLNLVGTPAIATMPSPTMQSTQSNIFSGLPVCATATGWGEPHLVTFGGLKYDFQATGDFLLAQAAGFTVQSRQATWTPNLAVNHALATQMGSDRIAVCTAPTRLSINKGSTVMFDGQTIKLPSGVVIHRSGDVYLITDRAGDYLRATVRNGGAYLDANVGLGAYPEPVVGLLANANGRADQLRTSGGTVLTVPVSFQDLYNRFGDSWRVASSTSLLNDCGQATAAGNPTAPFTVDDLDPQTRQSAQAVCRQAGVTDSRLLDPCTLDVATIGSSEAAAYVGMKPPVLVNN